MKPKRSMRARGPMIFYVFLIQILFALCVLSAVADDMNASAEDIGSDGKSTTDEIISAVDGCAAPVATDFSGGFDPQDFEMVNVTIDPDSGHMVLQNNTPDNQFR